MPLGDDPLRLMGKRQRVRSYQIQVTIRTNDQPVTISCTDAGTTTDDFGTRWMEVAARAVAE